MLRTTTMPNLGAPEMAICLGSVTVLGALWLLAYAVRLLIGRR